MSFSKGVLTLALLPMLVLADDESLNDILQNSKVVVNSPEELAETIAKEVEATEPADLGGTDWLKGTSLPASKESFTGSSAQQRGWNEISGHVESSTVVVDEGPPRPKVPDNIMYVYISLSMPEETIRSLFLQALDDKELRTVVFVLRGWDAPGPNTLVARLNRLFPDAQKLRELPNVQINPTLFQQQNIALVPTFSTKSSGGRWGSVVGSTSIADAVRRIEKNLYDGEVIGHTFEIEEPDILKLIQARLENVDWESHVERVKKDVLTKPTVGRALPYATSSSSYLVDLTIVNNGDLKGTSGEIFAPAGVSLNPFDYMTTSRRYIFFDANSDEQIQQALLWKHENDYTTMISTIPVRTTEGRKNAIARLGQPVHEINEMLISRFKIREVPAIAYQDGKMLRVDVVATTNSVAATPTGGQHD